MPLPALDSLIWEEDRPPSIALLAPGILPGETHVFVDLEHLPAGESLAIDALVRTLGERVGRFAERTVTMDPGGEIGLVESRPADRLTAILHEGGLGYEFHFASGASRSLKELPDTEQPLVWGLVESIAVIGARFPDFAASAPVAPGTRSAGSCP